MDTRTRICTKCYETKGVEEFTPRPSVKLDGRRSICKKCHNTARNLDKEENNRKNREWYAVNPKAAERAKKYRENNLEHLKECARKWRAKPESKTREAARLRQRYLDNKYKINAYMREWRKNNLGKMRIYMSKWMREKRRTDPAFKLSQNTRTRIRSALMGVEKLGRTEVLIGCTLEQLHSYIENLFVNGMTWDKFLKGKIHVDHIVPCCAFDLNRLSEQKKCFHYTNLRPLWAPDNQRKGGTERSHKEFAKRCANMEIFDVAIKWWF